MNAFETIKETYDIETLREIEEYGCSSGVAHDHIYYSDTLTFFDHFEDEIVEYIADMLGGEFNEELWNNNPCNLVGYKNDTVWCFIELVASQIVAEYEDTTCEELSDEDNPCFHMDQAFEELSTSTYESVKELASTPWGQDHLEIISA